MRARKMQKHMMIYDLKRFSIVTLAIINISFVAFSQTDFKTLVNSINWDGTESELIYKFHDIIESSKQEVWESENTESNFSFKNLEIAGFPVTKSYIRVNRNNKKLFRLNFIIFENETDLSLYPKIENSLIEDFGSPQKEDNDLLWISDNYKIESSFIDISNVLTPEVERYAYVVSIEPLSVFYVDWTQGIVTSNNSNSTIPQIEYFKTDNDNNVSYKEIGKKEISLKMNKTYNTPKGLVISFDGGMFCYRQEDNDIVFVRQGISITYPIVKK